jgi:predicted RNase H-like nuclease (RuvC/YqgF family)
MRSMMKIGLAAVLVLLVGTSIVLFQKYRQTSNTLASVQTEDQQTTARYEEALGSIATIQDSLDAIVLGDQAQPLASNSSFQTERSLNPNHSDAVLDRISVLRAGVQRSKDRIQQLDANLKKSGLKINGLEKMMAALKRNLKEKEDMVASLSTQVDSLHTQVDGLTATNTEQKQELGTVYCLIGDKKQLTTAGAVVATGGVLGIGKTLKPSGHVDESLCTTIDTDAETTVEIPAKKAQVLSAQPVASYTLETDGDHTLLRILDPKEFRKVRQLVIMKAA